jgi:hypothetical protein
LQVCLQYLITDVTLCNFVHFSCLQRLHPWFSLADVGEPRDVQADLPVATRIPASSLPPTLARFPLSHPSLSHPSSSRGERVSLNTVLVAGPAIPVVTQDSLFSSSLDLGLGTYLGLGRRRLYFFTPISSLFFFNLPYTSLGCSQCMRGRCY